jgi:GNAT superfamily N-acetyltransferase
MIRHEGAITIRVMNEADVLLLREVRLRALLDTPVAFGSTYAREAAFFEEQWRERACSWAREGVSRTLLAFEGDSCCGIVAGFVHREIAGRVCVVSMWVAPEVRRRGLGRRLIGEIEQWARQVGAREIMLDVNETNHAAIELYRRCGFSLTGHSWPYPNDVSLKELEMVKRVIA